MNPIRVVIADDHGVLRDLLRDKLKSQARFEVVHAAKDADEALEAVVRYKPDVVVLDIDMPGRDSFEVARAMRASVANVGVMFLSSHFRDRYIEMALEAGARGYLVKTSSADQIIDAIRQVATGGVAFSPEVLDRVVIDHGGMKLAAGSPTRLSMLSDREIEVLRYLGQGLSKKEIAKTMVLSVKTIQNHTDRLMQKLDIHDRVELARFAIREGLLSA